MKSFNIFVILSTILLGLPAAYSQCHQCLGNGVQCIDSTRFVYCFGNDLTTTKIQTCEEGFVCSNHQTICLPESETTPVACPTPAEQGRSCDQCTTNRRYNFACLGEEQFSRCDQEGNPDSTLAGSCPEGYVCNVGYDAVCVKKSFYEPSCFEEEQTTLEPVRDPTVSTISPSQQCAAFERDGRYPVGSDCSKYLVCKRQEGEVIGKEYSCPFPSYFNPQTKLCAIAKPEGCPDRTATTVTTQPPSLSPIPTTVTTVSNI